MFAIATFLILVYFGIWTGGLWNVRYHVRRYLPKTICPLPDLIHIYCKGSLRLSDRFKTILDIIPYIMIFITLITVLNPIEFLWYIGFIQIWRTICFNVTILPDVSQKAHLKSIASMFFTGGISDLIFSGHMAYLYGSCLFLYKERIISQFLFLTSVIFNSIYGFIIVYAKSHYTIDILVAVAFCHFVYDIHTV